MFTGLVEQIGQIAALERRPDGVRLQLRCAAPWAEPPALGASICCSGMCLTAVELSADGFAADVSNASLAVTTAGQWCEGSAINLETSLTLSRPLGGHLVTGLVDGVGRLLDRTVDGDNWILRFEAPMVDGEALARFIARKGSITVDGVSLTVNAVDGAQFLVNIIPHTRSVTTLGRLEPGDAVNLEVDLMARYAARLADFDTQQGQGA